MVARKSAVAGTALPPGRLASAWCPECETWTLPLLSGCCGWCDEPLTFEALRRERRRLLAIVVELRARIPATSSGRRGECRGCGCTLDSRTPGCRPCTWRHSKRQNAKQGGRLHLLGSATLPNQEGA